MVKIGELVDKRWVQMSANAGRELLAYDRCPMLQKIAGPILEFRMQRTLDFMMDDKKREVAIHPKYLHLLDRYRQRKGIQCKGGENNKRLVVSKT